MIIEPQAEIQAVAQEEVARHLRNAQSTPYIAYLDPDGKEWDLSDLTLSEGVICTAIAGISGMPIAFSSLPTLDGAATPQLYTPQPGSITLGLYVETPYGHDPREFYTNLDRVTMAFYNRRNRSPVPGFIIYGRPDGTRRKIAVYTISGLGESELYPTPCALMTLTLNAPDPYWYDDFTQELEVQPFGRPGILPLLPIDLGSFQMGSSVIMNDGGADAWPTWQFTGPGRPRLSNETTGRAFSFATHIPAGQVIQVTTKPGIQSVVNESDRSNWWGHLQDRDLWPLQQGANIVDLGMEDATDASLIKVIWNRRWVRA